MKLNIGSGNDFQQSGYLNIDLRKESKNIGLQSDARSLPFKSNSVEEIISFHLVEHVPMDDLVPMLREWHRVLKPGGSIAVECPEFDGTIEQYLYAPEGPERDVLLKIIYGFQPIDFHFNGLNAHRLERALSVAGFAEIFEGTPIRRIFGPIEPLLRMEAIKT